MMSSLTISLEVVADIAPTAKLTKPLLARISLAPLYTPDALLLRLRVLGHILLPQAQLCPLLRAWRFGILGS